MHVPGNVDGTAHLTPLTKALKNMFQTILNLAKRDTGIDNSFDVDKYDRGVNVYKKDTRGIGVWTSTDLSSLPPEGKTRMSDAMEKTFQKAGTANSELNQPECHAWQALRWYKNSM